MGNQVQITIAGLRKKKFFFYNWFNRIYLGSESVLWIRIGMDPQTFWSAGSESALGMRMNQIRKRKKDPKKLKKFQVLKCWMFSFEG
jgi:hypothetical protein